MPRLTQIKETKKGRLALFLDGEFAFSLDEDTFAAAALHQDDELEDWQIEELRKKSETRRALDKAMDYLSLRDHAAGELYQKLCRKFDAHSAAYAVARAGELGLLNDASFARRRAAELLRKRKSRREILNDLSAKGIDRMVLKVFFAGAKPDENGDRSRTFDELQHYVKQHATPVGDKLEDYQNTVKGKLADSEYVASDGIVAMVFGLVLGILIAFVPIGSIFFTDGAQANVIAAIISVPIVLVGIGVSLTFRRFTPEGAEVAARCKALKHWLEDFTRLKEAVPGDLVLWNKLLVMGAALGVSKEVLRQLAEAVPPEVREADGFYDNYPCYWWYYHHYGTESPLDSFDDVYHESIRELASSSDSSSGGGGGGFSGGGGGGVGGGGGGTF